MSRILKWVVPVGLVVTGLIIAYQLTMTGGWMYGITVGVLAPAISLTEWWFLRARSPDAAEVADRMLVGYWVLLFILGIGVRAY